MIEGVFTLSPQRNNQLGFTLVELVTTIILIGIIAVAVLPRLFSASSFSAYTLRNEFISELRYVQLKAIQKIFKKIRILVLFCGVAHKKCISSGGDDHRSCNRFGRFTTLWRQQQLAAILASKESE